jgi:hypothetical protein
MGISVVPADMAQTTERLLGKEERRSQEGGKEAVGVNRGGVKNIPGVRSTIHCLEEGCNCCRK